MEITSQTSTERFLPRTPGIRAFYTSTTPLASPLYGHPVFGARNPDRPVIDIEWPTRKSIITKEEAVVIRGKASGGGGIDQILVRGPRERYQLATGTTDWSSQGDLRLGSNRFTIKAVGATGDTTTKTITILSNSGPSSCQEPLASGSLRPPREQSSNLRVRRDLLLFLQQGHLASDSPAVAGNTPVPAQNSVAGDHHRQPIRSNRPGHGAN